jgi:hypothetical protein
VSYEVVTIIAAGTEVNMNNRNIENVLLPSVADASTVAGVDILEIPGNQELRNVVPVVMPARRMHG